MKEIRIRELLNNTKEPLAYGMIIYANSKTLWVVHESGKTERPVKLIALDAAELYEEFESLDAVTRAYSDIKIIGKMRL